MVQRGEAPCRLTLQGYQLSAAVVSRSVVRLFCGAASAPSPGTVHVVHVVHVVLVGRQPGLVRFDGIWLFTGRSVSVSTTVSPDRFSPTRWGPPSIRRRFSLSLSLCADRLASMSRRVTTCRHRNYPDSTGIHLRRVGRPWPPALGPPTGRRRILPGPIDADVAKLRRFRRIFDRRRLVAFRAHSVVFEIGVGLRFHSGEIDRTQGYSSSMKRWLYYLRSSIFLSLSFFQFAKSMMRLDAYLVLSVK